MALPSGIARLYRESAPAALVLFLWALPARGIFQPLGEVFVLAGSAMVLLYVGVRGVALAESNVAREPPDTAGEHLRENAYVAAAAAGWLLASTLVHARTYLVPHHLSVAPVRYGLDAASVGLAGGGVAAVLLYAVAAGVSRLRGEPATDRTA